MGWIEAIPEIRRTPPKDDVGIQNELPTLRGYCTPGPYF